jgi:hypothetical protein
MQLEAAGAFSGLFQFNPHRTLYRRFELGGVTEAAPRGVYQTERYGTFRYTLPDLNQRTLYTVRLHFSEKYWTSAGQRIFDFAINGTQGLSNFDVLATTGGLGTAIVEQFAANADSNGRIMINFFPQPPVPTRAPKSTGLNSERCNSPGDYAARGSRYRPSPTSACPGAWTARQGFLS